MVQLRTNPPKSSILGYVDVSEDEVLAGEVLLRRKPPPECFKGCFQVFKSVDGAGESIYHIRMSRHDLSHYSIEKVL